MISMPVHHRLTSQQFLRDPLKFHSGSLGGEQMQSKVSCLWRQQEGRDKDSNQQPPNGKPQALHQTTRL